VVEIDHTVADVHLIEPQTGTVIGRPVLTMMIDRATRVILGTLLSLEAPSQLSIGLCLHRGTFPKDDWLKHLGLTEACWPGFGLASTILSDNGREFHGRAFRRAAEVYGIDLRYRPLGHPAAGGIIERAIGTFMTKVRLLPGASFSKLLGKRPRDAIRGARMTLKELELYLARQVSAYHKNRHRTLQMSPVLAWERAWRNNGAPAVPRLPASADHFLLTFLPGEWRAVSREGIALHALRFRSPDLIPFIEPAAGGWYATILETYRASIWRRPPTILAQSLPVGPLWPFRSGNGMNCAHRSSKPADRETPIALRRSWLRIDR
jgi:putative transposase